MAKYYSRVHQQALQADADQEEHTMNVLEKFDQDLMSVFDCDPSWPLCLYNFTYKNLCPKYVPMKVKEHLSKFVIDDYFYTSDLQLEAS